VSSEPSADDASPALAHAKRIGKDVEDLALAAVEQLEPAPDSQAHHDAETVADPQEEQREEIKRRREENAGLGDFA
jgi:hypothetical protein